MKIARKFLSKPEKKICANFNCNFIETWGKSLKNNLRNLQKN